MGAYKRDEIGRLMIRVEYALRKEQPKRVIFEKGDLSSKFPTMKYDHWLCPECDEVIAWDVQIGTSQLPNDWDNYCRKCGQRLEWPMEDE